MNLLANVKQVLTDLIAFPALGGESNISIAEYIEAYLTAHDVSFYNVINEDGTKRSIHCRIGPAVDGGVILSGHMDVVPVTGQNWKTAPFELVEKDGKYYGRGTCDMKGFIACCLVMLPEMLKADLEKPIYFAFSYDEEVGCLAGVALAKAIKNTYKETPQFAIIGEPTNMETVIGEKGMGFFRTTISSTAGHSSQIINGASAIHEATKLILWLEHKMLGLIEKGEVNPRFEPPYTTIHIGTIEGGVAPNIIANQCTFRWDIRNLPTVNVNHILKEFDIFCKTSETKNQVRVPSFQIKTIAEIPPVPSLDTPENAAIVAFVNKLTGATTTTTVSYGSEAGQFAKEGFEAVLCGPGSILQAHQADEFVEIAQLEECVAFIEKLIKQCLSATTTTAAAATTTT